MSQRPHSHSTPEAWTSAIKPIRRTVLDPMATPHLLPIQAPPARAAIIARRLRRRQRIHRRAIAAAGVSQRLPAPSMATSNAEATTALELTSGATKPRRTSVAPSNTAPRPKRGSPKNVTPSSAAAGFRGSLSIATKVSSCSGHSLRPSKPSRQKGQNRTSELSDGGMPESGSPCVFPAIVLFAVPGNADSGPHKSRLRTISFRCSISGGMGQLEGVPIRCFFTSSASTRSLPSSTDK